MRWAKTLGQFTLGAFLVLSGGLPLIGIEIPLQDSAFNSLSLLAGLLVLLGAAE